MPFPDELARGLAVVAYDRRWPGDFAVLAQRIQGALGPMAVRVSHRARFIRPLDTGGPYGCREALFEIKAGLRTCGGSWKLRRCQFLELSR